MIHWLKLKTELLFHNDRAGFNMLEIGSSPISRLRGGLGMRAIKISLLVWTLILSTSWAQAPSPAIYNIDTTRSRIELAVFRSGILKVIGHDHAIVAKSFSGEIRFNPANIGDCTVQLSIDSGSLVVLDDPNVSEKDRKEIQANMEGPKVLSVREFPRITFQSTGVSRTTREDLILRGKLNLHGVGKEISFPVQIHPENNLLRVTGTATIAQTDFGIKPIKAAAGGLRVKDQVNVKFDIIAERAH